MTPQTTARRGHAAAVLTGMLAAVLTVGLAISATGDSGADGPGTIDGGVISEAAQQSVNKPTPRNFTGYGFDQCLTPTQHAMDAWLNRSPFWAVGVYISGKSRGCRTQPNLTPTWVRTQLAKGWRILPITLGAQASCSTRFPRYGNDPTISPDPTKNYAKARAMGRAEANTAVAEATRLGIVPRSTLWYDLEAFDIRQERCRESALRFVHAWTNRLHHHGYVSGYYSSAATGIKMLDDARVNRPGAFSLPDRIWIADWDGRANVDSSYVRPGGWKPGNRMKQYRGPKRETYGGVTIDIDRDYLDLGRGSVARRASTSCGGLSLDRTRWPVLRAGDKGAMVKRLQCLLQRQDRYSGQLTGVMDKGTLAAVRRLRAERGMPAGTTAGARVWTSLHAAGRSPLMKYGSYGEVVRRLQRSIDAVMPDAVPVTGTFAGQTTTAVKRYQARVGLARTGVVTAETWKKLKAGKG